MDSKHTKYDISQSECRIHSIRAWIMPMFCCLLLVACGGGSNNNQPVADAGVDQTGDVLVGDVVVLDGSKSSDANGQTLSYQWTLETIPTSSNATLSDATVAQSTFDADAPGTYVAKLIVNNGAMDSEPDEVTIIVAKRAPTVTIDTPKDQDIATANSVEVSGTVDDPDATITINGIATDNNNGSYSANTDLVEGMNTIAVIASNATGDGNASVTVLLKTRPGPSVTIYSPRNNFVEGEVWNGCGARPDNIPVTVRGMITTENPPVSVLVNNETATLVKRNPNPAVVLLCRIFPNSPRCDALKLDVYDFTANIVLNRGEQTIIAVGDDSVGGSTTVSIIGDADVCYIDEKYQDKDGNQLEPCTVSASDKMLAIRGNNQSNVCHAVDGCSLPKILGTHDDANYPMQGATHNVAPIKFGQGTYPPSEFFVHGRQSVYPVGCNKHDVCYQTCVPTDLDSRIAGWRACNNQQLEEHKAICRRAYPTTFCPYSGWDIYKCPAWRAEKTKCFSKAYEYWTGVSSGTPRLFPGDNVNNQPLESTGWGAYYWRQSQYCPSVPDIVLK